MIIMMLFIVLLLFVFVFVFDRMIVIDRWRQLMAVRAGLGPGLIDVPFQAVGVHCFGKRVGEILIRRHLHCLDFTFVYFS